MAKRTTRPAGTAPKLSGSYFNLLTPGNPKTVKGQKKGYYTFILHLAPANLSGFEVCPKRSAGCTKACLNTAGRGGITAGSILTYEAVLAGAYNAIQACRIRRTHLYFTDREIFVARLVEDIRRAIAWCDKWGFIPVFRLNGTSDIRWELASHEGRRVIGDLFSHIQFYDYTKLANRRNVPSNYHLTFSLSEDNAAEAEAALANGMNVAAVFRDEATVAAYRARIGEDQIHIGDDSDLRFLDPRGICALYAKGPAKLDVSGFVID